MAERLLQPRRESRPRRRSPLLRLLDHSFPLRLLLAAAGAIVALAGVNRWEQCRDQQFAAGCLWHDAGGVVSAANLEALSIMTAGFLFILEGPQRRRRQNHEAMELILSCQQAGVRYSQARNDALERLGEAGLGLDHFDLSGTDLDQIVLAGARCHGVILAGSSLRDADLRQVDLSAANLCASDLSGADLRGADLSGADLRGATLDQADLRGACLEAAELEGVDLTGARRDPPES